MKIFEITDIIHDDEEHNSLVETYLFTNKDEAMNKFIKLCDERIASIVDNKSDELDDEELSSYESEVREGFDWNVPSFNFYDDDYNWTTIRVDEKEVN